MLCHFFGLRILLHTTFGVHYRTMSQGQLGLWVAGFPGRWVTKCDPVPSVHCRLSEVVKKKYTEITTVLTLSTRREKKRQFTKGK